jgi:hypothetical protein
MEFYAGNAFGATSGKADTHEEKKMFSRKGAKAAKETHS